MGHSRNASRIKNKTSDPRQIAILDKANYARERFERYYARMRRNFAQMERERKRIARLQRQADKLD
jgi:hypothetical protein